MNPIFDLFNIYLTEKKCQFSRFILLIDQWIRIELKWIVWTNRRGIAVQRQQPIDAAVAVWPEPIATKDDCRPTAAWSRPSSDALRPSTTDAPSSAAAAAAVVAAVAGRKDCAFRPGLRNRPDSCAEERPEAMLRGWVPEIGRGCWMMRLVMWDDRPATRARSAPKRAFPKRVEDWANGIRSRWLGYPDWHAIPRWIRWRSRFWVWWTCWTARSARSCATGRRRSRRPSADAWRRS